jgi:hypothetical protein
MRPVDRTIRIPIARQRWPHPSEKVTVSKVAGIFGVNRRTLSRPIEHISDGKPARTTIPEVETAARIFAQHGSGAVPSVEAALLIDALQIPGSQVAEAPTQPGADQKEIRHRLSKKTIQELHDIPPNKVLDVYAEAHERVQEKSTINARRRIFAIVGVLVKRKIAVWPDRLTRIEGIPYDRFRVFATMADWTANAGPQDFRLFAYIEGNRRPVDFLLVPKRSWRSAKFIFLDVDGWLKAMRKGLTLEHVESERSEIAGSTGQAKKPKKGAPRP